MKKIIESAIRFAMSCAMNKSVKNFMKSGGALSLLIMLSFSPVGPVMADNFVVDKVYHPYVLPFEREFEWRLTSRQNDEGNLLMQRISAGHALSERTI